VPDPHRPALTRRALLAGASALVATLATGQTVRGSGVGEVTAQTPADHGIKLHLESSTKGKEVDRIPGSTTVRVVAGPDANGWYLVDRGAGSSANPGWTKGENLTFTKTARVLWDAGLYSSATDAAGWVGSLRHGVVVTVAGPATHGFTYVRYGDLFGYTYDSALEISDQPATDRYGEWWADVNRSTLRANLMIGATLVDSFPASMSSETGDGFYSTAPGTYWVYQKIEGLQYTPYAKAYFMYWCGFDTYRFNGFHSWTMDRNGWVLPGGSGNTAGCVATEPTQAAVIYNFLSIGSRVEIHW
jgi:hypothetical protein